MAEQTLLNIVQNIMSSMDSDEVNSIGDTVESRQVAQIVQNKYYDMVTRGFFTEHNQLVQLDPSLDPNKPVVMTRPIGVSKIYWVKYFDSNVLDGSGQDDEFGSFSHDLNTDITDTTTTWTASGTGTNTVSLGSKTFTLNISVPAFVGQNVSAVSTTNTMLGTVVSFNTSTLTLVMDCTSFTGSGTSGSWTVNGLANEQAPPGYLYVTILPQEQFIDYVGRLNTNDSNVGTFDFIQGGNTFTFNYNNDHQPRFCTIISDRYIIFDSYDNTQDDTLQASKVMCLAQIVPNFDLVDDFIPPLDDQEFPLLLNEAKALAWIELKQTPHPRADQEVRRQWNALQKIKALSNKPSFFQQLPDYGRVPRTGGFAGGGYGAYKWMRQAGP